MNAYTEDLRQKMVEPVERGTPRARPAATLPERREFVERITGAR